MRVDFRRCVTANGPSGKRASRRDLTFSRREQVNRRTTSAAAALQQSGPAAFPGGCAPLHTHRIPFGSIAPEANILAFSCFPHWRKFTGDCAPVDIRPIK